MSLARERGWVLTWDALDGLHLFNAAGERQAQVRSPGALASAASADDGQSYAAVGLGGQVWLMAPDLMPRWERTLPGRAVAVALDPLGHYLAASDAGGGLHVFDRAGRSVSRSAHPRPLTHLTFLAERPFLVASADFGLIACLELSGRCVWRDGLVAHVGSLSAAGDGSLTVLACYSGGLYAYGPDGAKSRRLLRPLPCRLASLSYTASRTLLLGLDSHLHLFHGDGPGRSLGRPDGEVAALALAPLGGEAWAALSTARVVCLDLA